jgi:hypothetical protein
MRERLLRGECPEWLAKHPRKDYIQRVCISTPPWQDIGALYVLRDKARLETKRTGHLHVLAHIVPVTHPRVSGLTVPWNLVITPWRKNLQDGNRFTDIEHEQLQLNFPKQHKLF